MLIVINFIVHVNMKKYNYEFTLQVFLAAEVSDYSSFEHIVLVNIF